MRTFTVGTISFFTLMVGSCVSFSSHQTLNNTQRRNKEALALKQSSNGNSNQLDDRRNFLNSCGAVLIFGASAIMPEKAEAKQPDCMSDCLKECKVIAPKVRYNSYFSCIIFIDTSQLTQQSQPHHHTH